MENKVAVVYRSKSGFTQKYAQWIAEAVNGDLINGKQAKLNDLLNYDTIVYGGGLYAGGIHGIKPMKRIFEKLKGKKLIVFWLGASPVREKTMNQIKNNNFTQDQQRSIRFFMLRGGFNYELCTPFDRFLMSILKMKLKSAKNPDADQRGMLASYSHPMDFTNPKYIAPIVEYIKSDCGPDNNSL